MVKNIIASIQYNNPEFIPLQIESINKYCKDSFDFFIVDNSKDEHIENEINRQCNLYDILSYKCLHHIEKAENSEKAVNPCKHHATSINEFINYFKTHYKKHNLIILDSDIFLPKPLSFYTYFEKHKMFGDIRIRPINAKEDSEIIKYLWPGYCGFRYDCDFNQLDFNNGFINDIRVGAGGFLYYYIKDKLDQVYSTTIQDDGNFHLICGSNWSVAGSARPCPEDINDYTNRKKIFLESFVNYKYFSEYAIDQFINNFEGRSIEHKISTYVAQ